MSPQKKVVSIDNGMPLGSKGSSRQGTQGKSMDTLSVPVKAFADLAEKELKVLMQTLFDGADDTLFKLSDAASSNDQQERYFNAMREVRLQRRQVESKFFQSFRSTLIELTNGGSIAARQADKVSLDSLSLVENDELEERVALEAMFNKAFAANKEVLSYISQRLAYLLARDDVSENENPVAPINLCDHFAEALSALSLDIEARLLVFKLFDKHVLSSLSVFYEELDKLLVTHGALPDMKQKAKKQSPSTRRDSESESSDDSDAELKASDLKPIFRSLQQLLNQSAQANVTSGEVDMLVASPSYQGPTQAPRELCQILSEAQVPSANDENELQGWLQFDVRKYVRAAMKDAAPQGRALPMKRSDNDAINLVAMLFEFILDDRNIVPTIRAMLARLQLPLVKLALQDQKFFDQKSHPARGLLNALASAAVGFYSQNDRFQERLKFKIEEVVTRICNEYQSDSDIFDLLLADFQLFNERESKRVALVTQRLQDAEEGKAKTDNARTWVKEALSKASEGYRPLPETVETLMTDAWSKVLFLSVLKSGHDSNEWQHDVFTIQQMLWTIAGEHNRATRPVLLKVIPTVQKKIRKGLTDVSFNPYDSSRMLKELESLQIAMLKQASTVEGTPEQAEQAKEWLVQSSSAIEKLTEVSEDISPKEALVAIDQVLTQQVQDDDSLSEFLDKVDTVSNGSWFKRVDEGEETRCKLAAALPRLDKYIFVNHAGIKVHECTRSVFAKQLQSGSLTLIDSGSVFDRALRAVVKNLRQPA